MGPVSSSQIAAIFRFCRKNMAEPGQKMLLIWDGGSG
jgi:hypothetical protein